MRKQLGEILLEMGALTELELTEAMQRLLSVPGQRLGQYLIASGVVNESNVAMALARQFDLPFETVESLHVDREVARIISEDYARSQRILPISNDNTNLVVAVVDPVDIYTLDDLRFVSGVGVQPVMVTDQTLDVLIKRAFGREEPAAAGPPLAPPVGRNPYTERGLAGQVQPAAPEPARAPAATQEPAEIREARPAERPPNEDASVVKLTDEILKNAVEQGASDIHIEPLDKQVRVRFRVDGVLHEFSRLDKALHANVISRIKIMGGVDISERRIPQDGRIEIAVAGHTIDVRVSTLPTVYGEKAVLRILDKTHGIASLGSLGMNDSSFSLFRQALRRSYGMILACGPTGSGKTTTMISALQELNRPEVNVITIEDPVEYEVPGVNHVAVNVRAGLTFASGLRSMLRQDPDIILVGEIRDAETAEIATRGALTGHLVLSTMHTNDCAGAITRLIDMKVERFLVASSIVAVVAQRLVRRLCGHCKRPHSLPADDPRRFALDLPKGPLEVYQAVGCARCRQTGYRGRVGIYEVFVPDANIRELILTGAAAEQIKEAARTLGMQTLQEDGVEKALSGITSLEEVVRITLID